VNRGREILVGAVILAGIVVTIVGTLWLSGSNFGRPSVELDVLVSEVGQLGEGNQVKFRGVAVGRVTSFEVEPDGNAVRIHLELDQDLPLPGDVGAVISPESLFGEWQVELVSRARFSFDFLEVSDSLADSSPVPVLPGFAMPDITRLTAAANEISQNLAVLTDRVDRAFSEETAENIRLAIENISQASTNIRALLDQQATTFAQVTAEVEVAAAEISAAAQAGRHFLQRADSLMATGQVDSVLSSTRRTTANLARITNDVAVASEDLPSTLARADSALARLDRLTARIAGGEGIIGQLMTDTALVEKVGAVLTELDLLLADLRENPKRYVRLSIF
jgi:phospholipid/cholesterol/gamma-HCH transport system substrate-binding protein